MNSTSTAPFGLSRIGQIAVVVHDVPRAVAFYRDTLGMRLLFEAPPSMAFFDCAGVRLMLSLGRHPNVGAVPRPEPIASVGLLTRGLLPEDSANLDIGSADEAGARNVAGREEGDAHRPATVVDAECHVSGGRTHRRARDRAPHD